MYARWPRPARFDRNLVVIGAGSAGLVSAYIAAAVKAKVTLIEKHRMGGDCLNTGCVPSKALLRSAKLAAQIRRAQGLRHPPGRAEFDFADVMERVQRVIRTVEPHDSAERYTGLGVDVVQGEAKITSPWTVEIRRATAETDADHARHRDRGRRAPVRAADSRDRGRAAADLRHRGSCASFRRAWSCWAAGRSAASSRRRSRAWARR